MLILLANHVIAKFPTEGICLSRAKLYQWSRTSDGNWPENSTWYNYFGGNRVYYFYLDKFSFVAIRYFSDAIDLFHVFCLGTEVNLFFS